MDWKKIKAEAWEISGNNKWNLWKPQLVISLISMVISIVCMICFGEDSNVTNLITNIFSLLLIPAEVGVIAYTLKVVRNQDFSLEDLKVYYPQFAKLLVLNLLIGLFTLLGFILLIIPGIIIALQYTFALYVFVDNENLSRKEIMVKSKEMMNGYKGDFFAFELSFIGWILLCVFIIPAIWVVPYIVTANALYYEDLKNKNTQI